MSRCPLLLLEDKEALKFIGGRAFGGKSHDIVRVTLMIESTQEFLKLNCPRWASSNSSVWVQVFLPRQWFPWCFLLLRLFSGELWYFLFSCPFNLVGSGLPCVLLSRVYSKKLSFQSVQLLEWACDFQDFCTWNQKPCFLFEIFFFLFTRNNFKVRQNLLRQNKEKLFTFTQIPHILKFNLFYVEDRHAF